MTNYVTDTFTDTDGTNLSDHTPEVGGAWAPYDSECVVDSGTLVGQLFATTTEYNDVTLPSADYQVSADVLFAFSSTNNKAGLMLRGVGAFQGYTAFWDGLDSTWKLYGDFVQLGTFADSTFTSGSRRLLLSAVGSLITVQVDGSNVISVTDSTRSATGAPGVYLEGGYADAFALDNFSVDDVGGGGGGGGSPTVHSDLSGQGSFTPSAEIAGVTIELTTAPAYLGTGKGNPGRLFEVGNIAFGRDGFYTRNHYIEHVMEIVETHFGGVDEVVYSFGAGVVAEITELPSL